MTMSAPERQSMIDVSDVVQDSSMTLTSSPAMNEIEPAT